MEKQEITITIQSDADLCDLLELVQEMAKELADILTMDYDVNVFLDVETITVERK